MQHKILQGMSTKQIYGDKYYRYTWLALIIRLSIICALKLINLSLVTSIGKAKVLKNIMFLLVAIKVEGGRRIIACK